MAMVIIVLTILTAVRVLDEPKARILTLLIKQKHFQLFVFHPELAAHHVLGIYLNGLIGRRLFRWGKWIVIRNVVEYVFEFVEEHITVVTAGHVEIARVEVEREVHGLAFRRCCVCVTVCGRRRCLRIGRSR